MSLSRQSSVILKCGICVKYPSDSSNDRFVTTECGHIFHEFCINRWFRENVGRRCPLDQRLIELEKLIPLFGYDPSNRQLKVKIAVLGDHGVGKTSMVRRFTTGERYMNVLSTTSMDLHRADMVVDFENVNLNIWDAPGQQRFHQGILPQCIRDCHGIIFCYDPMHFQSLINVNRIWKDIASRFLRHHDIYASVLLECKNDLAECTCETKNNFCRPISDLEKRTALQFLGTDLFSTSVANSSSEDVEAPFKLLVQKILRDERLMEQVLNDSVDSNETIQLGNEDDDQKSLWEKFKTKCC